MDDTNFTSTYFQQIPGLFRVEDSLLSTDHKMHQSTSPTLVKHQKIDLIKAENRSEF